MDLQLKNRVALITGGSRGIGRSIALCLASEGCNVSICGRTQTDLEATGQELQAHGVQVHSSIVDVKESGKLEGFIEETASSLDGIDFLVANVGGTIGGSLLESSLGDWVATFELNVFHCVRAIRAVVPYMRQRGGGSILLIASISGWKPAPRAQYGAAKAAEIYLAGALADELAPDRIRVNTLSPGSILFEGGGWDGRRQRQPEEFAEFERREFPWGRLGTPEEVADVAVFLLSNRSRWINGANIPVDGHQGRPTMM